MINKHISHLVAVVFAFACLAFFAIPGMALANAFMFGVNADNWEGQVHGPGYAEALKKMGVQFIVWHLSPEEAVSSRLQVIVDFCRENDLYYLFNTELTNYVPDVPYFENPDGTYRWDIKSATLEQLESDPLFLGQVYDEPMLMQSLTGSTVNGKSFHPYFIDTNSMSPKDAFMAVSREISERSAQLASFGKLNVFEMVFPDYAASPARGDAILAPKLLKENPNDLMFAVYAGAARQYGSKELWACVDLWFLDRFPDKGVGGEGFHSPDDLYDALTYAYAKGFDRAYVEHLKALMNYDTGKLTTYGKKVVEFQKIKSTLPRTDWREFKPEVVVKRFPDGYWGQKYSAILPNHPYGSEEATPRPTPAAKEWLELLSQLSSGKLPPEANNWNAVNHPYFQKTPYFPLAGLPPMLVFDHTFEDGTRFEDADYIDLTTQ